jgi:hypothetical protein
MRACRLFGLFALLATASADHSALRRSTLIREQMPRALAGSAPANDNFADRASLSPTSPSLGTLLFATAEADEPKPTALPSPVTVWYKWTATVTGEARVLVDYASNNVSKVGRPGNVRHLVCTHAAVLVSSVCGA